MDGGSMDLSMDALGTSLRRIDLDAGGLAAVRREPGRDLRRAPVRPLPGSGPLCG